MCWEPGSVMSAFFIYLLAGLATGSQVFWLMMWSIWGAPISSFHYVALLGGIGLVAAAYVALFKLHVAAMMALASALGLWAFYIPAIYFSLQQVLKYGVKWQILPFVPPALLLLCTAYATAALFNRPRRVLPSPAATIQQRRITLAASVAVAVALVAVWAVFLGQTSTATRQMRWTLGPQDEIVLTYVEAPEYFEMLRSAGLVRELQNSGTNPVKVQFRVTRDFGKVRGYTMITIQDRPIPPSTPGVSGSRCGTGPCVSPWD